MGKNGGTYVELGEDLYASLQALCDAQNGAQKTLIIRNAVRQYIQTELDNNDGVRERYNAICERERRKPFANLTVIE